MVCYNIDRLSIQWIISIHSVDNLHKMEPRLYPRLATPLLQAALLDSPAVLLVGARQTGKTTLAKTLTQNNNAAAPYFTMDDATNFSLATSDPTGFIAGLGSGPVILDEVQRVPVLFPAIKAAVDTRRTPGRFLLTGSANVLVLPRISESLAGRMEIVTLWPLAQIEIEPGGGQESIIDRWFSQEPLPAASFLPTPHTDLTRRLMAGGFPEPLSRSDPARRRAWFRSYTTALLQRDVRDLAQIENVAALPRLLGLLASRAANLLNVSDISRSVDVPYATLTRYLSLLEATYLIHTLPAWSSNLGLRLIKSPKLLFTDTGLAASLMGLDAKRLENEPHLIGSLLENFAAMELVKLSSWSQTQPTLFHFRTTAQQEVDLVLESPSGHIVGVEVKASATVGPSDFKGLRALAEMGGKERFVRGLVLYTGDQIVPFGENLAAVPLASLWKG